MNIEEALIGVSQAPESGVLVAKPAFTWGSEAMFVRYNEQSGIPDSIVKQGYEFPLDRAGIEDLLLDIR